MEKKTMGSFLAALRRANGMTQKELAERLNVSDKSVSRWERDDGAPDLALIPVIAEVFGVTCDELLRGERVAAGEEQGAQSTPKGEQQKKHLLAASLSRFRSRCCIALALAAAGFLVAMACNSALDRALLGFFLGAVFFVAAAAVETVQLNAAFLAVHGEEGEDVDAFRSAVVRSAAWPRAGWSTVTSHRGPDRRTDAACQVRPSVAVSVHRPSWSAWLISTSGVTSRSTSCSAATARR